METADTINNWTCNFDIKQQLKSAIVSHMLLSLVRPRKGVTDPKRAHPNCVGEESEP